MSGFSAYLSHLPPNIRGANYRIDVKDPQPLYDTAVAVTLRAAIEAAVMRAALDEHYAQHPKARPDLADIAIAAAELDAGGGSGAHPPRRRRDSGSSPSSGAGGCPALGRGQGVSVMTRLEVLDDEAVQALNKSRRQLVAAGIGSAVSFRQHREPR